MGIVIAATFITMGIIIVGLCAAVFMERHNKDFRQNFMSRINKDRD